MIDQNFIAKVLIRLILHDESYTSKACHQHNPAVRVAIATVFDVHPGKERLGAGQPDPSLRASTRVVMVGLLPRLGGDSVRVFKEFAWLEAGSGKMALSRPAHLRVTRTVGRRIKTRLRGKHQRRMLYW